MTLSEEDTKLRFITPAIVGKGWSFDDITMETGVKITDGKINISGNVVVRSPKKRADYILYYNRATPIAIVEAKDTSNSVSHGLQQAMQYCKMMDVPFAYSSNGGGFCEHDFLTGTERVLSIDEFPTKEELYARFLSESNNGQGFSDPEKKVIDQPYCSGQNIFPPRYYQRNAVNRTVNAVAQGKKRLLLVMATGTGKTYVAFQIIHRLLGAGMTRKVLYLADRNILVDQSVQQDFKPLEKVIHKVNYQEDKEKPVTAYKVYFALYQQLIGKEGKQNYKELFKPEFFDMVVVDECHRGSAKDDSNWREILDYFRDAIQLGMTATPKETKYQSSITYFGEPIYLYSLKNGIDDGFLAPFKVINITTNIGDGWRPTKGQTDIFGNEIEDRIYNNSDYDYNIIIQDRIREVAHRISSYLRHTDRMAKTIVFCANEEHAELMRSELVNENSDLCRINPDYVVRITGSDAYGQSKLSYFISVNENYPVIATTSKLLSTGVDCKMVKLIVLDQNISSMTEFKQIVGRGTRIKEEEGKTNFAIMDFRNVTRLFADPEWDGPLEVVEDYNKGEPYLTVSHESPILNDPAEKYSNKPVVDKNGCAVTVINAVVYVYDTEGKLLRTESIIDYTKRNILDNFANIDIFRSSWKSMERKGEIIDMFKEYGIDIQALMEKQEMKDVDIYDFICHIAFGKKALTRKERAENVKKRDIFNNYGDQARKILEALLDKYMNDGIREIENINVLDNDPFRQMGSPAAIIKMFGSKEMYQNAVKELEEYIYNVA